jgi:CheY-like chemotaxis protein
MPGSNGRQLVDAALVLRPDLKVIYMTGYTRNAIVHNGTLDAGTRLLTKPFTLEQLDRELRDALSGE